MKSTIRLFKALPIIKQNIIVKSSEQTNEINKTSIKKGFIFSPEVLNSYTITDLNKFINNIGISSKQLNSSFHKSWKKIAESPIEQLVVEQIIHYITTYGFESLGVYNKDSVYIPNEKLEIPEITEDIKLVVIKGYTVSELKDKLLNLLYSGIALGKETIEDIVDIALYVNISEYELSKVKNKEVRIKLYDMLGKIPENPIEFLRYIIYKSTGETLIIKSSELITKIKESSFKGEITLLFSRYSNQYELNNLSSIFYRFKPIFLAFRFNTNMKKFINKLRKKAEKYHTPMSEDYLNTITDKIRNDIPIDYVRLDKELSRVNIFRKVRLANALNYRLNNPEYILYRIRNGKSFVEDYESIDTNVINSVLKIVVKSIAENMNCKDKKIYIPEYVKYAIPTTEKQFIENIPYGTYVEIENDMLVGVYWENVGRSRIDLDLASIDINGSKVGWDGNYRYNNILFSGDMTDASNGASELLYVKRNEENHRLVSLNYFNYDENIPVPFKIIIAKKMLNDFYKNYMVNPNNLIVSIDSIMDVKQKYLGYMSVDTDFNRFYFVNTTIGNSRSSSRSKQFNKCISYFKSYCQSLITLNTILVEAGALLVDSKEDCDIDLSLENLEKDTILNLMLKENNNE